MIVGLGNPGPAYEQTRHNLGFILVRAFAHANGLAFRAETRFEGLLAHGVVAGQKVYLLLPMTYMNLSGRSVKKVAEYYDIAPADTLIVLDDVALDFARILLKAAGSAGGHRGLASVQDYLRTTSLPRLRVGIGDRVHGLLEDYVLGKFSAAEAAKLDALCKRAVEVIDLWLQKKIEVAMNLANATEKKQKTQHNKDLPLKGEEKVDESKQT